MPCPKALGERKLTMFYAQTWRPGEPFMAAARRSIGER